MPTTPRPQSVRAIGARRLAQATAGMVVVAVGGVIGLVVHEASGADHAAATTSTTSTTDQTATSSGSSGSTGTSTGSSMLGSTQSAPDATSGGS